MGKEYELVGGQPVKIIPLEVTEAGTTYAPSGSAYDPVVVDDSLITPKGKKTITGTAEVDVTEYATAQVVDENLVAENIKSGVTILGVEGTYTGEK